ncbi:MAG: HD domain-containing protein [Clostridiales bacterium]|jgi:exopolyphosphatase/guanosine-5'-triphosphate,3'-diphosphate pyrophosphatase|nr:HD domain-containing protein [Clostridiales bacterium]
MPKKMKISLAGVIDVGSSELRLKIAQLSKNKMKYLESLTYPLALGRDTFNTGKISFEKVDKACEIIKNFLLICKEYTVTDIRVLATTAVREATNMDYFLDQVKIKTGMSINVIDDTEEKLYIYKILTRLSKVDVISSALMVHIGSGNIGVALLQGGRILLTRNIKVGSLRISELFDDIEEYSGEFYIVLEEYLHSYTDLLTNDVPDNIKHFIVSGTEISVLSGLTGVENNEMITNIPKPTFLSFYQEVINKSTHNASKDYNLSIDKAELLLPTMCIFNNLMKLTNAEKIIAADVMLSDAILFEMLCADEFALINKDFGKNAVLSARTLARKYDAMESHYDLVSGFAQKIFDKMKKLHGMGQKERILLQIGAILHDVGKFINLNEHHEHSYKIIKSSEIVGLNQYETEIIANLALYHANRTPSASDESYSKLDLYNRVLVSKLTAILRLADALDQSHVQKFDTIDAKLTDNELIVTIATDKNIHLEQWSFKLKSDFFEEVFGIKAIVKQKKIL